MRDPTDCLLPPELEFIIIDYLFADKPALASCSLVSSRWLPPSRRHLFHDITIKPCKHLSPDPLKDFLQALNDSEEGNLEWAFGPCIKNITFDGRAWEPRSVIPTLTCPLSLLCTFLSSLPHLASLCVKKLFMPDDLPQDPNADRHGRHRFKLDKLIVSWCSGPAHDPHHLLALICTFSSIDSLTVISWGRYVPHPVTTFSSFVLSPPTVRSLAVEMMSDVLTPQAIYTLLVDPPSVANEQHLTHVSVDAISNQELVSFSDFAKVAGPMFREVELRANSELQIDPSELLDDVSLATCTALRSLVLCMELSFDDHAASGDLHADDTRMTLHMHTQFFHEHRDALPLLTVVRLEMRPVGRWMLDAFVRVARDTYREWGEELVQTVSAEEAEKNREVWASLEDALDGFPALQRVEFVLYERDGETLTEEAEIELRGALERRLPRMWPSGVSQLVFEMFVYRPR